MASTGPPARLRDALVAALAGGAFTVGLVATVEVLLALLPATRGTLQTWGPITTVIAGSAVVGLGLPVALLVEGFTYRARKRALATLAGYGIAVVTAGLAASALWRRVAGTDPVLSLYFILTAGALGIWGGARLAEATPRGPVAVFAFAAVALTALAGATALVLR